MAAPIAHLYLALQVLTGPLAGQFNEQEFLVGTSFPDIRYLRCIKREQTHYPNVTLEDIRKEKSSFRAGLLFHSLVDEKREEYIEKNNIYKKLPIFRFITQSLKFAEDKLLTHFFNAEMYQSYFDSIHPEERAYNISEETLHKWHDFLKNYFKNNFSIKVLTASYVDYFASNLSLMKRLMFAWYYTRKISSTVDTIVNDKPIRECLLDFYLNFTNRLQEK